MRGLFESWILRREITSIDKLFSSWLFSGPWQMFWQNSFGKLSLTSHKKNFFSSNFKKTDFHNFIRLTFLCEFFIKLWNFSKHNFEVKKKFCLWFYFSFWATKKYANCFKNILSFLFFFKVHLLALPILHCGSFFAHFTDRYIQTSLSKT